jgi:myo-inositol-1-phosphate synthase
MPEVKMAIVGIGNVGGTFVQGLAYYSQNRNKLGLWHDKVGGLKPADIKIVAAFDIDPSKVGKNLAAIAGTNSKNYSPIKDSKIEINQGLINETETPKDFPSRTASPKEVGNVLEHSGAQIIVNVISSGMDKTSREYAKVALKNGISFVNATPTVLAANPLLNKQFQKEKLTIVGDDLLSQFGGTAFHKGMVDFMVERGVRVNKSYQLDVGGSSETKRTMDEGIRMMKRAIKTNSIGMEAPYKFESVAGTTEYTDFLGDSRNSYYWMSSEGFLGSKIVMDLTLSTSDAANAGNVLLDVIRASASKKGIKESDRISAYGFKNPPKKKGIRTAYSDFVKVFV